MPPLGPRNRMPACGCLVSVVSRRESYSHDYSTADEMGSDVSSSLAAETACLASIHFGAASRSSSGRFMVNAATTIFWRSHQTLKLLVAVSPRWTIASAPAASPQYSYERSKT